MFGTYRTVLAVFVVLAHFAKLNPLGSNAVYSFFCLSGFLMALLMCKTYAGRWPCNDLIGAIRNAPLRPALD